MLNIQTVMNMNSLIEVSDLFDKLKERGEKIAFVTNEGTMHDLFDISVSAKRTGIIPKMGVKFPFRIGQNLVTLALYPKNDSAKKNLFKLTTMFHKNSKRNLGLEGLGKVLKEMVIVIDSKEIDAKIVKETILTLNTLISNHQMFVGLHEKLNLDNQAKNMEISEVLVEEGIKYVPFNEIKYLTEDDYETFNFLMDMKEKEQVDDLDNLLLSKEEYERIFEYMAEYPDGTDDLISMVQANFIMEQEEIKMPSFSVPENFNVFEKFTNQFSDYIQKSEKSKIDSASYLFTLVMNGVYRKYGQNELAFTRAVKELEVIINKDFADYFLIVWDFMNYARKSGILTGPGRGSVVGCIVAYCLDITDISPLEDNLQFERFLNPYRVGMPDIDVDVSSRQREEIINYLRGKYGENHVARLLTKTNYGFKTAKTDILKTMRVPKQRVEELDTYKPHKFTSVEELVANKPDVQNLMDKSKDIRVLTKQSYRISRIPRGTSTNAASVIVSNVDLTESMPMMYDADDNGKLLTQIINDNDQNTLEKMGFLKFDILGLINLDIKERIKELIEAKTKKEFVIEKEDPETLRFLNETKYLGGIFQLESYGARKAIEQIGINNFYDIVITNAFNRPGPADFIPLYAERKGKPIKMFSETGEELENVEDLYPILQDTAGIMIFQEQINDVVRKWANYNLAEADMYRRAISKKKTDVLLKEGENFIKKSIENGRDEQTTKELFKIIMRFVNYGFNKSHAVSYSQITYELAFMKTHHPVEFYVALLSFRKSKDYVSKYVGEAREMGIEVYAPDINISLDEYTVENTGIRCSLSMVSDVGEKAAKAIVEERTKGGNFKHIYDVVKRFKVNPNVQKSTLLNLAYAGVFDSIGKRNEIINHLLDGKNKVEEFTQGEKVMMELKYCNVAFSIDSNDMSKIIKLTSIKPTLQACVLKEVLETKDKYKRLMAKVKIETLDGKIIPTVIFNKLWVEQKEYIKTGEIVLIEVEKNVINSITTL